MDRSEPFQSLLAREVTILSKNFGQLQRTCWELGRVLLRERDSYDKMAINKGKSGAKQYSEPHSYPNPGFVPDEPSWIQEEIPMKTVPVDNDDPRKTTRKKRGSS